MLLFHTDLFVLPLPDGHRFPMVRYRLLRERLEQCAQFSAQQMCVPPAATDEQLLRVHTADWVNRVSKGELTKEELRRIGFPWSPEMAERSRRSTGATIAAGRCAIEDGIAANLAGGTHHAFADRGAGYCVFNDVAVAIRTLQHECAIERAMVIDADVHQGDGTAQIFANDQSVDTFSIHAQKAFPVRKQQSDLDIALPPGCDDRRYIAALERGLHWAAQLRRPDIAFYLAGADPYEKDKLGGLAVSKEGLLERDRLVMEFCREQSLPVVITLAGGYAEDVNDIVDIQFQTILLAKNLAS